MTHRTNSNLRIHVIDTGDEFHQEWRVWCSECGWQPKTHRDENTAYEHRNGHINRHKNRK